MTTITYKDNITEYATESGKAIGNEIEDARAALKKIGAEISAGDAVADGNSADPDIGDLIRGDITASPSWSERRLSLLRSKQKLNDHIDALSLKLDKENTKAEMKLAAEIEPAVDALEKEIIDAAVVLHALQSKHFAAKRSFLNNGIGTYGNFSSTIDDVLGVPVNGNTPLAWLFREAVKKGQLKRMPVGLA